MIFAKDLILKGVAGLAVVGGLGAGGIYVWNQRKGESLQFLTEKVGLSCTAGATPTETNGVECQIKTGSVLAAKQNDNKDTGLSKDSSASTSGKIKVYRDETEGEQRYEHGFKFTIEEANITLTGGSVSDESKKVKTLEEFETYEIKEDTADKKWYLTRKSDSNTVKEKLLGLPEGCKLPSTTSSTCNEAALDTDKLNKINFEGKGENPATVETDSDLKLTITKVTDSDTDFPNGGYKFVFKTNKDVTVNGTESSKNISIKKGADLEFKIQKSGTSLTLEKAWTAKSLGEKVGIVCTEPNASEKSCTLKETGINVHNGSTHKYSNLSRGTGNDTKKVKYEIDKQDYNQGFKFYTEEADGITLQNGTGAGGGDDANKKIENKGSGSSEVFYEIKQDGTTWYLTKKTGTGA